MKKLAVSLVLVLSLVSVTLAGGTHMPGAPVPLPTPCPEGEVCGEDTGNSSFVIVWINGVFIVLPF